MLIVIKPSFSQEYTQIIRGKVVDAQSKAPIEFANINITTTEHKIGTISDENGDFRIENVPVGRHDLIISFIGYEPRLIREIMVGSGKENVIEIALSESIEVIDEVEIKAYQQKGTPINQMASLSVRSFSVEEAQRYAGGMDDPARLASAFAGVSTGYLEDNGIIIRGNAPKGLLWRLEGIEIPNPNHFADMTCFGGGGISALSSHMLANSDFFTGAFPAEYGNALSGVFDLKFRTGNNEQYEHALKLGAMGIDLASEGPFSKNSKSSYLINYRYSTFGIIKAVLPEEVNVPVYQDLSFNLNFPTKNLGKFSLWALAADDAIEFIPDEDTANWARIFDQRTGGATQSMAASGLNHRLILSEKTYLNSSLAFTASVMDYEKGTMDFDDSNYDEEKVNTQNYAFTLTSNLNHKFSAKHTNRTGFILRNIHYNTKIDYAPQLGSPLTNLIDENGSSMNYQVYSQSKFRFNKKLSANLGLHNQYFALNEEFIIEPRAGITYKLSNFQSIGFAYGKHSRLEPLNIYFSQNRISGNTSNALKISKAHHFVAAYDLSISPELRLKIEPYYQYLYDIPSSPDSSYSTINLEANWFLNKELNNSGTGRNLGIDLTLERFLKNGYYYLATISLFESKYTAGDGVERDTRFNGNYVINLLAGKEWKIGESKNHILGINGRLNFLGGQRLTPVNYELSGLANGVVYDYSRPFEEQKPPIYHINFSANYRINRKHTSHIFSIQIMNLLGSKEFYGYHYNYRKNEVEKYELAVVVPDISYKIEF